MFDINNPGTPPGMVGITSANPMQALGGGNPMRTQNWRHQFHEADWGGQRPSRGDMNPMDWRTALMGWRDMRPDRDMFRMGQAPQVPGQVPQQPAPQQTLPTAPPNYQLPLNPYGG